MSILGNSKLLVSAVSTWNNSGIKQAEKSIGKFEKNLGKLARTLGLTFSAVAVVAFGKASVKAFLADDKAAKALGQTLKNTGNELAGKGANSFIDKLQRATGVSDGQLRPALTNLLNSTRDYKTSQQELNLALDIAAGTSKDVISVSAALSKAYAGNTGALSKLGTGISKTLLASGDMVKINKELARLFAGQSAIAANTYAGKIERIKVAADEAKETIGKGLIDALTMLGKNKGVDDITKQMDNLSLSIADVIRGIGTLSDPSQPKSFVGFLAATISELYKYSAIRKGILALEQRGAASRLAGTATQGMPSSARSILSQEARTKAALDKAERDKIAREKKSAAAKLAADKKAAALKLSLGKGQAAFDLTKIQIAAALKMNIDEDTRKRLLLMQALEGDNSDLILKRLKELEDFQTASIAKIAAAQALADKSRQDALELYMKIMGLASAKFTPIGYMAPTAAQQQQIFATTGNYTPPTMAQQGQIFATAPPTNNMPEGYTSPTAAERNQIFGTTASTTVIAPTVLPVVLTDSAGFQSAIQQQLQILARDGASTAATSGLVNQFL